MNLIEPQRLPKRHQFVEKRLDLPERRVDRSI